MLVIKNKLNYNLFKLSLILYIEPTSSKYFLLQYQALTFVVKAKLTLSCFFLLILLTTGSAITKINNAIIAHKLINDKVTSLQYLYMSIFYKYGKTALPLSYLIIQCSYFCFSVKNYRCHFISNYQGWNRTDISCLSTT